MNVSCNHRGDVDRYLFVVTGPSSAVVVPAVVLPVVVLILIIAVIIVIVGIYLGRRRHFRDYRFRRMAMSELKDEDL